MKITKPFRLAIAQAVCRYLPPIVSQRVREIIYPRELAYQDGFQETVRAKTGSLYSGNTADHHLYPFIVHGYYYWRAWAIALAVCSQGDTVVEIGANVGTETIGFSDIVGQSGRVIAFEPLLSNLDALSVALENTRWKNISIHPFAVGDSDTTARFFVPVLPQNSGIGYVVNNPQNVSDGLIEVRVVRLDSFLSREILPRLIFMDVEGFEIKVLRGAREIIAQHAPVLVLEASSKLLKRAGFTLEELFSEIAGLDYLPFGVSRLDLVDLNVQTGSTFSNWVCLPKTMLSLRPVIRKSLRQCGLYPCIPGINPMTRIEGL